MRRNQSNGFSIIKETNGDYFFIKLPVLKTPGNILVHVFKQLAKVLPMDTNAKKQFVINKGLRKILEKKNKIASDPSIKKAIDDICTIYPEEMVKYYTPDYREVLLKKLEEYHPNEV